MQTDAKYHRGEQKEHNCLWLRAAIIFTCLTVVECEKHWLWVLLWHTHTEILMAFHFILFYFVVHTQNKYMGCWHNARAYLAAAAAMEMVSEEKTQTSVCVCVLHRIKSSERTNERKKVIFRGGCFLLKLRSTFMLCKSWNYVSGILDWFYGRCWNFMQSLVHNRTAHIAYIWSNIILGAVQVK